MTAEELKDYSIASAAYRDSQSFPQIFHYTSFEAFHSMLFSSNEFWFSNAKYLNDKRELVDFIEKIKSATYEAVENKEKHQLFFDKINSELPKSYPWIFCFSERRDDASQWERYADKAAGVCIKFNTYNFSKILRCISGACYLQRVFYDYDVRNHQHFNNIVRLIDDGCVDGFSNEDALIDNILATAASYKHHSFEAESEVRAVILLLLKDSEIYHYQNGIVKSLIKIGYLDLCRKANVEVSDLFDEIIIGPRSNQDLELLKKYFISNGYPQLADRIIKSDCPLR